MFDILVIIIIYLARILRNYLARILRNIHKKIYFNFKLNLN